MSTSYASPTATALTLWLRSVKQPQISGRFEAIADKLVNGRGVWRQVGVVDDDRASIDSRGYGPGWLYNSADNHWFVTVHESCVGETGGILGALEETSDEEELPLDSDHAWKRWDGPDLGWNESVQKEDIQWTTSIDVGREWEREIYRSLQERRESWPNQLLVEEERNIDFSVPEELLGIYTIKGRGAGKNTQSTSQSLPTFCGQPVWENIFGSHLFSDAFGFWRIAASSEDLVNAGPSGYVQSQDIVAANALPPNDPSIVWMVDGGGCGCESSRKSKTDESPIREWSVNPHLKVMVPPEDTCT